MDDETRETNKTLIQRWTVVKKENKITVSPNYVKIVKISNIKKVKRVWLKNKTKNDRIELKQISFSSWISGCRKECDRKKTGLLKFKQYKRITCDQRGKKDINKKICMNENLKLESTTLRWSICCDV